MKHLLALLLLSLSSLSCKVASQKVAKPKDPLPQSRPIGGSQGFTPSSATPYIQVHSFGQGSLVLAAGQMKDSVDYYAYELCRQASPEECQQGTFPWEGRAFLGLAKGKYRFRLRTCVKNLTLSGAEHLCSAAVTQEFTVEKELPEALFSDVEELKKLSGEIRSFGKQIYLAILDYQKHRQQEISQPEEEVQAFLQNMVDIGPDGIGALLNSEQLEHLALQFGLEGSVPDETIEQSRIDLETKIDLFEKAEIKTSRSNQKPWGAFLITLGSLSVFGGVMLFGAAYFVENSQKSISAIPDDLGDQQIKESIEFASSKLRRIVHNILGYVGAMTAPELEQRMEYENAKIQNPGEHFVKTTTADGRTIWKRNGVIQYLVVGKAIYQKDSGLIAFPEGFNESNYKSLTEAQWMTLPHSIRIDYAKADGGRYELRQGLGSYEEIEGRLVKKYYPEYRNRFPNLDRETVDKLYNNQIRLMEAGRMSIDEVDAAWPKGVPLFDTEGRLVEPPDAWKVAGQNWFVDGPGQAPQDLELRGTRYTQEMIADPDKILLTTLPRPQPEAGGLLQGWMARLQDWGNQSFRQMSGFTEKLLRTDVALKWVEYDLQARRAPAGVTFTQLKGQAKGSFGAKPRHLRGAGIAAVVLGVGVVTGGFLSLAGSDKAPLAKLKKKLEKIFFQVTAKQLSRLQRASSLMKRMRTLGGDVPTDYRWVYLL